MYIVPGELPSGQSQGVPRTVWFENRLQVSNLLLYIRGGKPELFLKSTSSSHHGVVYCPLVQCSTEGDSPHSHTYYRELQTAESVYHIRSVLSDLISALQCSSGLLTLWQGRGDMSMYVCVFHLGGQPIH